MNGKTTLNLNGSIGQGILDIPLSLEMGGGGTWRLKF